MRTQRVNPLLPFHSRSKPSQKGGKGLTAKIKYVLIAIAIIGACSYVTFSRTQTRKVLNSSVLVSLTKEKTTERVALSSEKPKNYKAESEVESNSKTPQAPNPSLEILATTAGDAASEQSVVPAPVDTVINDLTGTLDPNSGSGSHRGSSTSSVFEAEAEDSAGKLVGAETQLPIQTQVPTAPTRALSEDSASSLGQAATGVHADVTVAQSDGRVNPNAGHIQDAAGDMEPKRDGELSSLYDFDPLDIDGLPLPLARFRGKVVIVVNVASACGFTESNYRGLTTLYDKYDRYGLEILAFPCNQFGGQEPGEDAAVKRFAQTQYGARFPLFSKVLVNGPGAHPLFHWLKRALPTAQGGGGGREPGTDLTWNFNKFVVDRAGRPRYLFRQDFNVEAVETAVRTLLMESPLAAAALAKKADVATAATGAY